MREVSLWVDSILTAPMVNLATSSFSPTRTLKNDMAKAASLFGAGHAPAFCPRRMRPAPYSVGFRSDEIKERDAKLKRKTYGQES